MADARDHTAAHQPVLPPCSYGQLLPADILSLIVAYLLYDRTAQHRDILAIFTATTFGHFGQSSRWAKLWADYPRVLYRRYISTNNYSAASFLRYDGTIDYRRAWECANDAIYGSNQPKKSKRRSNARGPGLDARETDLHARWNYGYEQDYDLVLADLRTQIGTRLRFLAGKLTSTHGEVSDALIRYLRLPDLLAVSHPLLEQAFLALCARVPADVGRILTEANPYVIHYSLWVSLYTTYLEPRMGTALRYGGSVDLFSPEQICWLRLWFRAALQTDDVTIFTQTCEYLGFTRADIVSLVCYGGGGSLGLRPSTFYYFDALALVTELDLWREIGYYDISKFIILRAPRLRQALVTRRYVIPIHALSELQLRGLPPDIYPFLPTILSPLFIIKCDTLTPGGTLALLRRTGRDLNWFEMYQLFLAHTTRTHNLITYILPVERLVEPAVRAAVIYLDQHWGFMPTLDGGQEEVAPALLAQQSNYTRLYRLLLIYVLERNEELRTPFHYYPVDMFVGDKTILVDRESCPSWAAKRVELSGDSASAAHPVRTAVFAARPYARILLVKRGSGILFPSGTQVLRRSTITFVYLPAANSMVVVGLTNEVVLGLYNYDITDFAWWCAAFKARYSHDNISE